MKLAGWTFWIFLALAIAGGGFIAWHALTHSHDAGVIVDAKTACPHAWAPDQTPIPVVLEEASAEVEEDLRASVAFWNKTLGGGVLTYAGRVPSIDGAAGIPVIITWSAKDLPQAEHGVDLERGDVVRGATRHLFDAACRQLAAPITLLGDPTLHPDTRRRHVAHELGHALGLGHDQSSIGRLMHPDSKFQAYDVSAADVAQLRAAMGVR